MKNRKILNLKVFLIAIFFVIALNTKSYGAVAITKGTSTFTNRSISDFYDMCKGMKNAGEGLEGTSVDVHMATNKEWATVSYFSNSSYGTGGAGGNTGIEIEGGYRSTNGNATGVMDWGKTVTLTAGVINNYMNLDPASAEYTNGKSIIEEAKNNSKYVEVLPNGNNSSIFPNIAKNGWYGSWTWMSTDLRYPYSIRSGLFGFVAGYGVGSAASGAPRSDSTFRPVILN